jgi:hypothetical protein
MRERAFEKAATPIAKFGSSFLRCTAKVKLCSSLAYPLLRRKMTQFIIS